MFNNLKDTPTIINEISDKGFCVVESCLSNELLQKIDYDLGDIKFSLNENQVPFVLWRNQRYLTHCLARSREIYDVMTSDFVMNILRAYFKEKFRVTDQRVYVSTRHEKMQWHVDNKLDTREQTEYPGLIFIFYLSETEEGFFQLVNKSNEWSRKFQADFSDTYIRTNHANDVLDFRCPKGTLIIYDTQMVHRAAPIKSTNVERKSLFFQVERKELGGEPIILNSSFLSDLDEEKAYYLGFGAESEYQIYPMTSSRTINPSDLLRISFTSFLSVIRALPASLVWRLGPDSRARIKSLVSRFSKNNH